MSVTVLERAVSRRFIEPSYVRMMLGLSQSDMSDTKLDALIENACAYIENYCNRRGEMFNERVSETFRPLRSVDSLFFTRYPVTLVESVTEGTSVLDTTYWNVVYGDDSQPARLDRMDGAGYASQWGYPVVYSPSYAVTVIYRAGYSADDDTGGTIPADLREAALKIIDRTRLSLGRDASVRSEEVPGVARISYDTAGGNPSSVEFSSPFSPEEILRKYSRLSYG